MRAERECGIGQDGLIKIQDGFCCGGTSIEYNFSLVCAKWEVWYCIPQKITEAFGHSTFYRPHKTFVSNWSWPTQMKGLPPCLAVLPTAVLARR